MKKTGIVSLAVFFLLLCGGVGLTDGPRQGVKRRAPRLVQVYDDDGQFLGFLLGQAGSHAEIYLPRLSLTTFIDKESGDIYDFDEGVTYGHWNDSVDCAGTYYTQSGGYPMDVIMRRSNVHIQPYPIFYIRGGTQPPSVLIYSRLNPGGCENYGESWEQSGVSPIVEITEAELPFRVPVKTPIRYRVK